MTRTQSIPRLAVDAPPPTPEIRSIEIAFRAALSALRRGDTATYLALWAAALSCLRRRPACPDGAAFLGPWRATNETFESLSEVRHALHAVQGGTGPYLPAFSDPLMPPGPAAGPAEVRPRRADAREKTVVVGSGAFPYTVLGLARRGGACEVWGVDSDPDRIVISREVCRRDPLGDRTRFVADEGASFDYRGAGAVFVTAAVRGKDAILGRIRATARASVTVYVGRPKGWGAAWYEDVSEIGCAGWEVADRYGGADDAVTETTVLRRSSGRPNVFASPGTKPGMV